MLKLRDYQTSAVNDIRQSYIEQFNAPILVLPTGGGKTVIFCEIARLSSAGGKNVWILVHRVELLRQTSAALSKSSVAHGLINAKYTPNPTARVQVASVQTLVNRLNRFPAPDLIIIDEAHHATAGSWRKVIEAFPNARVLGVTATPIRGDRKGLGVQSGGIFDTLVMGPQIPDLMDRGFLVQPQVYAAKKKLDLSGVRVIRGDYDKAQITELVDRPTITGDAVEHYTKLCPGAPAVAFCVSIKHAENVAEDFRAAGYKAYSVDGNMDDDRRAAILEGLGTGSVQVVASCDIISEGTDIPNIRCAIMLRPTQSTGLYIQQGGRALRPVYADGFDLSTDDGRLAAIAASNKPTALILDHVGNTYEHGLLTQERDWDLAGKRSKKRKKSDEEEESILVTQCPQCFHVYKPLPPGSVCPGPGCDYVKPIQSKNVIEIEGELELITKEREAEIKAAKRREVQKARTLEELEAIEKARNYKPGWAKRLFDARNKRMFQ